MAQLNCPTCYQGVWMDQFGNICDNHRASNMSLNFNPNYPMNPMWMGTWHGHPPSVGMYPYPVPVPLGNVNSSRPASPTQSIKSRRSHLSKKSHRKYRETDSDDEDEEIEDRRSVFSHNDRNERKSARLSERGRALRETASMPREVRKKDNGDARKREIIEMRKRELLEAQKELLKTQRELMEADEELMESEDEDMSDEVFDRRKKDPIINKRTNLEIQKNELLEVQNNELLKTQKEKLLEAQKEELLEVNKKELLEVQKKDILKAKKKEHEKESTDKELLKLYKKELLESKRKELLESRKKKLLEENNEAKVKEQKNLRISSSSEEISLSESQKGESEEIEELNERKEEPKLSSTLPVIPDKNWECEHCTFVNEAGTIVCLVCCKTPTRSCKVIEVNKNVKRKLSDKKGKSNEENKILKETESILSKIGKLNVTEENKSNSGALERKKGRPLRKITFWPGTKFSSLRH